MINFWCMALVRHSNTLMSELEYIFWCQAFARIHRCNSMRLDILCKRQYTVSSMSRIQIDNLDRIRDIFRWVDI